MKTLHLIRHAKSSWESAALTDIDRPLNARGLASCEVMAPKIVEAGCQFENTFCSVAQRAQLTIEHIAIALNEQGVLGELNWAVERSLYTFESADLMKWCRSLDDGLAEVVIVGHNNALTDFCNAVGDQEMKNVPTCAYVQLAIDLEKWQDLSANSARVTSFLRPKMFMR